MNPELIMVGIDVAHTVIHICIALLLVTLVFKAVAGRLERE